MADLVVSANVFSLLQQSTFALFRSTLGLGGLATVTPGTGVATALAIATGASGGVILVGGNAGTPSGIVLTNGTGLPIAGITGLGTGVGTFLATPSGANLASALTTALPDSKGGTGLTALGTGVATALGVAVGSAGAPVLFNGAGGTPSSLTLTNALNLPLGSLTDSVAGADRLAMWDQSASNWVECVLGTGLSFSGTTLNVSAGVGDVTQASNATAVNKLFVSGGTDKSRVETPVSVDASTGNITGVGNLTGSAADVTTFKIGGVTVTASAAELNFVDGVTSAIQTQLDAKAPTANATFTGTFTAPNGTITLAMMANLAQDQFIVRTTASTGVPQTATVTAAARTVLDDITVAAMVDTLGGASSSGTGGLARLTSPTFVTPVLGTPTSGNASNMTVDGTNAIGFRNIPQNSQSAAYTAVLADAGKSIDHPSTDANARTFTIPSNASVAYAIGDCLSFSNMTSQAVTIAITSDTLNLAGVGTTGSRTLAQYGVATARKVASTVWLINGTGLT